MIKLVVRCQAFAKLLRVENSISAITQIRHQSNNESDKIEYEQGQYLPDGRIREYFYYLDHQGQLFLDDTKMKNFTSCYKEQKFLEFFFKNLHKNETNRFPLHFPFVSLCGRERNYLRCDDLPLVITHLKEQIDLVNINQIRWAHWMYKFDPANLYHNPNTGRLYYHLKNMSAVGNNAERRVTLPCQVALIKSEISLELLKSMKMVPHESGDERKNEYEFEYKSRVHRISSDPENPVARLVQRFSAYRPNYDDWPSDHKMSNVSH